MIYQRLSKRQLLAMLWWQHPQFRDRDALLCDGAIRSGKTVCMAAGFFLWSMSSFDGQRFALCGKTIESLRRNLVLNLHDWLPGEFNMQERRAENKLVVRFAGRVNHYFLFGGKDESSYMLIQGITLAGVLFDEVTLMPESFVNQATARCSVEGSKLWFNCNPARPEHWFRKKWLLQKSGSTALHLHFTMVDNPALSPRIRARYESMYDGVFYSRYILGEWTLAEGLVYRLFDPARHVCEASALPEQGIWYISVDYGTLNPFSAGLWCVGDGVAVRTAEYYHSGRDTGHQMTDADYCGAITNLAAGHDIKRVVVDPSAASMIAALRRCGYHVQPADNDVLNGIQCVAQLLKSGGLQIGAGCKDAIREFGLYRWDEKSGQDRVIKTDDHAMDDIRYFCYTVARHLLKERDRRNFKSLWVAR